MSELDSYVDDDFWWCIRPYLEDLSLWRPGSWRIRVAHRVPRHASIPNFCQSGDTLAIVSTLNQARTLEPIIGSALPVTAPGVVRARALRSALSGSFGRGVETAGATILRDLSMKDLVPVWRRACARTRYVWTATRDLMKIVDPTAIVVSTQHDPAVRAVIRQAQTRSTPTIYIPHAPVARKAIYMDLPTTHVGLRGRGEVDFYRELCEVPPNRLHIVGNPATSVMNLPPPVNPGTSFGVLALSPDSTHVLERLVALVNQSGVRNLVVAPHPRSNLEELRRLVPPGWKINEQGRTIDLLMERPRFLLQYSSGVAWEAAALGVPTAQLSIDQESPDYPFLDDQIAFPRLRSGEDVRHFVREAGYGAAEIARRRAVAAYWCGSDGLASQERAAVLLRLAPTDGERGSPVYDGWSVTGKALLTSRFSRWR